uniref:ANK_REP_REGION domain-containing protein n=1 Tax=Globodera pallida TaxID=36090 RepID=A0A183C6F6_GLOPA
MAQPHLKLVKHFFSLIQKGDAEGVRSLLANHFGESLKNYFRSATLEGVSPLFFAAREGHLEVCKVLVAEGADANQKSGDGDIAVGQDIEVTGNDGATGLIAACIEKKANVVGFLLSKGACIDRTRDGMTIYCWGLGANI